MLVLTRRPNQSVEIDGGIQVTLLSIRNGQARIGFTAPAHIHIVRTELEPLEGVTDDNDGTNKRANPSQPHGKPKQGREIATTSSLATTVNKSSALARKRVLPTVAGARASDC